MSKDNIVFNLNGQDLDDIICAFYELSFQGGDYCKRRMNYIIKKLYKQRNKFIRGI